MTTKLSAIEPILSCCNIRFQAPDGGPRKILFSSKVSAFVGVTFVMLDFPVYKTLRNNNLQLELVYLLKKDMNKIRALYIEAFKFLAYCCH